MAKTGSIRAGRAFVELFADDSRLVRGLRRAEGRIRAFGASIRRIGMQVAGLGAAIAAPLIAATRVSARMGDELAKMSARTGVSVESLSELGFAAEQSGADIETLETGLRRMQQSVYQAGKGLATASEALARLGLSAAELENLSPERQFKLIADRLSQVSDPTMRAAIAMEIFGRSGTRLLPMLTDGAAGIEALQNEARRLGITMSTEDARAAEAFTDALNRLWKVVRMGVFQVGAALAPAITELAERITRAAVMIRDWIEENRRLIVTVAKVAAGVIAAGLAIAAIGTVISGFGLILGKLITAVTFAAGIFKILVMTITAVLSPIGLVTAGAVALGAAIIKSSGAASAAISWLGQKFADLKDTTLKTFGGIADALAAGDIALAAKVLWLSIRMEWTRGVGFLKNAWAGFRDFFLKLGTDAFHGLQAAMEIALHGLEVGWIETTAFFVKCWQGFVGFFARSWQNIKAGAQKAWNWIKSLFDSSIDLETENRLVDERRQQAIDRIEDDSARREAQRQEDRRRAREAHEERLGEIGIENLQMRRELDSDYARRIAENEAQMAAVRKEWQDAVEEARKKREETPAPQGLEGPRDRLMDAVEGLGDVLAKAEIAITGTFQGAAVERLSSSGPADRTAIATEETARNTKRILDEVRRGGASFA